MKQLRQSRGLYFFTPEQFAEEVDLLITFTALTHGQLIALENLISDSLHSEFTYQSCKLSVIDIQDKEGNLLGFDVLSPRLLTELSLKILEMSSTTEEELQSLQQAISVKFSKTFKADTWNCEVCKSKRLDRMRNCGFRGEKEKNPDFKIHADNQVYTYCPIYDIDHDLLADGVDSYLMYDNNMLPNDGGLYDQTRFFVLASSAITQKLREEEQKDAEAERRKNK